MPQQGATGPEKVGVGVGLCFQCRDAPDGYHINFFSPTDQREDMLLSEFEAMRG